VLDAGTGLRSLSEIWAYQPFRGSILLSHLHWDHVQGIPFFVSGDQDGATVQVLLPGQQQRTGEELLAQSMAPPAFPITPKGLLGDWSFLATEPGTHSVEGYSVTAAEIRHKGGRTFGYRVSDGQVDVAYLPDHVAAGDVTAGVETLVRDVDLLIHDAQFLEPERALADAYGHSTVDDAIRLAHRYEARRLMLFHHGPGRTDEQLDAIGDRVEASLPVDLAREGAVVEVVA
jgi:ribonuclease BN (tRNA processing enzyme)